jgi:hypothetical protein
MNQINNLNQVNKMNQHKINIIDFHNNESYFNVHIKELNYIHTLLENLNTDQFFDFFKKTMSMYKRFKFKKMINHLERNNYYRRCQFLSILQSMAMIGGSLSLYNNSTGIIKIGPSKNSRKNCCIIDDSTVLDKGTNQIRDSIGNDDEPNRGHRLFYQFDFKERNDIITIFDFMLGQFIDIFIKIIDNKYILFDPIYMLKRIINYCKTKKYFNVISYLSWEIHDSPYLLTLEEKLELFNNDELLYSLWNNDFITNNKGKLRIYILCCYFIELLERNDIKEF